MIKPFMMASELEKKDVCTFAQKMVSNLDDEHLKKVNVVEVLQPDSPANCEHSHTKYEVNKDNKD